MFSKRHELCKTCCQFDEASKVFVVVKLGLYANKTKAMMVIEASMDQTTGGYSVCQL